MVAVGCGADSEAGSDGAEGGAAQPTLPARLDDRTGSAQVQVEIVDNDYEPADIRVDPGTEIVFTNTGANQHNVTPVDPSQFDKIDQQDLEGGSPQTLTFDEPGTYFFYCSLHGSPTRGQNGVIVVGDG